MVDVSSRAKEKQRVKRNKTGINSKM